MKKQMKWKLGILLLLLLCIAPQGNVRTIAHAAAASTAKKTGWVTKKGVTYYYLENGKKKTGWLEQNGKKYYFNKNGEMQTGWQTIRKKVYYFNKKGIMQRRWQTIKKKTYFFGSNGVRRKGLRTIDQKQYYFDDDGIMQTGWVDIGDMTYYFHKKTGVMVSSKTKKKLSELEKLCESIVNKTVKSGDSNTVKLKKLFQYITWNYGYTRTYGFSPVKNWDKTKALNMLKTKSGNCYSYAAAFGYLAKKATGLPVRIYYGMTPGSSVPWTPHGWCEVQIDGAWRVFDPDLYRYVYKSDPQFCNGIRSNVYYSVQGYAKVKF